eukprot:scaffold14143_cov129-Isochrysis_galbana.AAC.3
MHWVGGAFQASAPQLSASLSGFPSPFSESPCVVFSRAWRVPTDPPMGGTAHQALTAANGGSMPAPAKHPSLRHPRSKNNQVRPTPAAQRAP